MCIIKQIGIGLFFEILQHSTDGHWEGQYFLCSGIPYPKKTNMKEIWSPRILSHCPTVLLADSWLCVSKTSFALPAHSSLHPQRSWQQILIVQDGNVALAINSERKRIKWTVPPEKAEMTPKFINRSCLTIKKRLCN